MEQLIAKQMELMERVPHELRPGVVPPMVQGVNIIKELLLYLTSMGHKPWRPNPLPVETQQIRLHNFLHAARLIKHHKGAELPVEVVNAGFKRKLVSTYGIIEEATEYLDACVDPTKNEKDRLEELTDILFFYLEQLIQSGFTWEQVKAEYYRKHAINLKRYEDGARGDYSWDKRKEGAL